MRKKFLLMLTLLILALGGGGKLFAQELLVNYEYNSSTEGWGTTKFSNYAGAYAYATANAKKATIVIEKTNTISGNCFDNNHEDYSSLAVVIKDGATMGNSLSKWDMTYPVTVEPGGTLTCARGKDNSISNIHIKNKLIVGVKGATKKAYVNFLSDEYQDCDISIRYNGSIEVYNADFYVQDLDAQGKLTIEDSKVEVDGAFASATSSFYPTTLTNSTIAINGTQIEGGLSDFAGGTYNQLGNVKINNSTLTIKEGDTKVATQYLAGTMEAKGSTIEVNNLTIADGATLNLNEGSTLDAENITVNGTGSVKIDGEPAKIENGQIVDPIAQIGGTKYYSLAEAAAAATANDEIVLLADATVEGTLALPAGIKLTSNGHTITGSIRMLGSLELNGPLTITGGLWVGKSGETLTATLSGDKLTAGYFMFQRGTYTINADIDAVYGYLSYEAAFEVNSTIHTTGANGEVLYINGNVTLNDGAVLDSDNSVFVCNDNAVLTLMKGSKVDSNVNITASGAKINIDANGMAAGTSANITGTVTNSVNGTIAVINNDKLEAQIVDGKIVLVAKVAMIGETSYTTLQAAIEAVQEGETITVLEDITFTTGANGSTNGISYTRGVSFTLDLNGKTITSNLGNNALRFKIGDGNSVVNTEVTIKIENGKIVSGANNWCAISAATADNSGNKLILNLTDLAVEANKGGDFAVKSWAGAVVNTNNVDVTTNYAGGFYAVGGEIVLDANSSVAQKGLHTAPYMSYAFGVSSGTGKMTINGGTYSAVPAATADAYNQGASHGSSVGGVMSSGGTLIINGGTFSNDNFGDAAPTYPRALLMADAGAKVKINGGTFNAMAKIVDPTNNAGGANAEVTISGGTFSANPTDAPYNLVKLAENYVAVENNGVWNVVKAVAKIGEQGYATLQDAINAVQDGETIKLVADLVIDSETYTIADGKNVTLDLNGKKITVTDNKAGNNTQANYELFYILGEMTVTGNGTIELTATNNREWNASSSIFHNRGGVLNIENGTFKHLGGTDMAYVIDNSGNWAPDATTNVKGGEIASSYIGIRNRMDKSDNSGKAILNVSGGKISGTKRAIWGQASSSSEAAPAKGEINVSGGEVGLIETARNATAQSMTTVTGGTVDAFKGEVGELKVTGGTVNNVTIYDAAGEVVDYMVNAEGVYVDKGAVIGNGTWGGIDWSLTNDGTLTIAPTEGEPVPDKNAPTKRTYEVGEWREAVIYKPNGSASAIGGYPYDVKAIKKLIIEEGVIKIGSFTAQFPNLTGEVVIPSTVTYIGQEAFHKTPITKLTFAEGGTEHLCIANGAFKKILIEEVSFPGDRKHIHLHHWAFGGSPNLKTAYIPANVIKSWGGEHVDYFDNFNSQTNVTWAEYGSIFTGCTKMETIEFETEDARDRFFANNRQTTDEDYIVAAVGLWAYNTMEKAIEKVQNNGTVYLYNKAALEEPWEIPAEWNITFNICNNKILTGSILASNANLTVNNGTIKNTNQDVSAIEINAGTLTLNDVNISSKRHAVRIDGKVVATIDGGTYKVLGENNGTYHAVNISGDAEVTIDGGTFVGPKGTSADSGSAVNVQAGAEVTINGGKFSGGKTKTLGVGGDLVIYGGKYDQDPSAYVADKYMAEKADEWYNVVKTIAMIGETPYASLQSAIDAVKDGETITLINDVTENVKLTEKVDLYYTINGDSKTMNGKIDIIPLSDENDNRRITIEKIKFKNTTDAEVDFISCVKTNHYPRLTVKDCSFTGNGNNTDVALRLKTAYGAVISNCTGTGLHSFLQNTAGKDFTIEKVTVTDSKSGLALGTVQGVTVKDCDINVAGYGIRMDAQYNNNAVIESNTIEAFIPVVVRKAEVDGNITFKGTNKFDESNEDGYWCVIGDEEYETNGKLPTAAKGRVSVVVNSDLPQSGLYGNYVSGTLSVVYTGTDGFWGECGGNANYSFEFKFFNGETFMGSTSLNDDIDNIIDGDVYVTWNMKLDAASNTDQYWTMEWEKAPTIAMQPNRVEQWVDGVKVAECEIQPNGPDNLEPIVAAVAAGEDLVIKSFATSLEAAVAAAEGNTVVLLKDINETLTVVKPTSNINIDGNGKTVKGGMSFGSDDNKLDNYSIVVSNVKFEGKGLSVKELTSVKINKNTFVNITEGNAITVICDGLTETVNVSGNTINDVSAGTGIRIRNAVEAVVDRNNIDGTFNNAILLEGTTSGDVYVTNNVLTNWGKDTVEKGRAIRIAKGADTEATITGNAMTHDNAPEQFVKVSANTENVNINENYWNGKNPAIEGLFDVANVYPENYYSDAALTKLETISYVAKIGDTYYATLAAAFKAVTDDNKTVVICKDVTENLTGAYLRGNITTENDTKVTINLTNSDWVYCPYTFVLGENITLNVPALFYYAGGTQINGTLVVDAYYQRYAGTKLTINEPGSMTVNTEQFYLRLMDGDANAGIYIVGDNNNETVGLNLSVAYFYQGMINAKDANIQVGTYWQTNETDNAGSANLVLDNSTLTVTVNEHNAKATGNSTVTLKNGATMTCAGGLEVGADANFNVEDATMKVDGKFTNNGTVNYTDATVELAKLDNDKLMFLNGDMTIKVEDATGSSYAIRANDNVVFNNSYVKGTANETVRLLGSATFNGGFQCSYLQGSSAGVGGTVTIAENTTVKATYGIEFSKDYVLNGGTLELSGGDASGKLWGCVFQSGTFALNTDVVVTGNSGTYAPIHFTEAEATVNGNITQTTSGGEPIYINEGSEVTFAKTSTVTTDCSVHVSGELYGQGNVYGKITKVGEDSNIELTGGVYTQNVKEFCAEGYTAVKNADGKTWTVDVAIATVNNVAYIDLQEAIDAAVTTPTTITLAADFATEAYYTIASDKNIILELNGKTITGTDNATGSFGLINNKGTLTIVDGTRAGGAITLKANVDRDWNAYSSVISNQPGGKLIVVGGTIEHLGGTDMAYAIDNLTNGKGTYAETEINGGIVKSPYRAIRQFLNGVEADNILTVKGGTIEGANKSIWMQDPSKNANTGKLIVEDAASIKGDVYLSVTEGSTEWPVVVAIVADALKDGSTVLTSNVPEGYLLVEDGGFYSVKTINEIDQTISLRNGWTWTSLFVDATSGEELDSIKKELGDNGIQIKNQLSATTNFGNGVWKGSLTSLSVNSMYMVKVTDVQTLTINDYQVNPADYEINLVNGWTWIGFPSTQDLTREVALKNIHPVTGDQIKGQEGFATYMEGYGWYGSLLKLEAGKGYMYKNNSGNKSFRYPAAANYRGEAHVANITAANNLMVPNVSKYADNMSIIAVVNIDGEELMSEGFEVAAFAGNELRGSARPIYLEDFNRYMLFMTVYGEANEELTFKYYDLNSGEELNLLADSKVEFEINGIVGSLEEALVLNYGTLSIDENSLNGFNVYPNPVNRDNAISFETTFDKVEVYNSLGVVVAEYANVDQIDGIDAAGIYVIKVTNDNAVKYCRVIVK